MEELGKCKRTLDGDFVGTNINRKLWQIFRAQLTGVWPYTRAKGKKNRQNLGSLASDPVSGMSSFALGKGGDVYFRKKKKKLWKTETKQSIWSTTHVCGDLQWILSGARAASLMSFGNVYQNSTPIAPTWGQGASSK